MVCPAALVVVLLELRAWPTRPRLAAVALVRLGPEAVLRRRGGQGRVGLAALRRDGSERGRGLQQLMQSHVLRRRGGEGGGGEPGLEERGQGGGLVEEAAKQVHGQEGQGRGGADVGEAGGLGGGGEVAPTAEEHEARGRGERGQRSREARKVHLRQMDTGEG